MTEKQGGVPLPPGEVHIYYDPSTAPVDSTQQPQAQQAAVFEAKPNNDVPNGSTLDANLHFVVYAVKNGLIRVLHRNSTNRSLLRGHEGKTVTDISFFQNADVLGTVGGNVIVWRVFERANEIVAEKLLEIPDTFNSVSRLVWHPFNPNQFWLIHRNHNNINVATLVETTRIKTVAHPTESHAVCRLFSDNVVMQGATQVAVEGANLTDLCWSQRGTRHVMTTHDDGSIKLWDIKTEATAQTTPEGVVPAVCISTISYHEPVTRCLFLPHDNVATNYGASPESTITPAFCTASKGNSCITLWSPFTEGETPTKLQVFQMEGEDPSYNIGMAWGPSFSQSEEPGAFFFLLSDRNKGNMYALSLKSIRGSYEPRTALVEGFEYLVPFSTKYPTYSWSLTVVPAESLDDNTTVVGGLNYDIKFYALQSKMVQDMKIPHYMLLPPTSLWEADTRGVRMELLARSASCSDSGGGVMEGQIFEEDYELDEVEDDDDDDDEDYGAPDPSSLPTPDGLSNSNPGGNPFANWLGNLAGKAPAPAPSPSPVLPPVPPSTPATGVMTPSGPPPGLMAAVTLAPTEASSSTRQGSGLLSPMEILSGGGSNNDLDKEVVVVENSQQQHKQKSKQRGRSPKRGISPRLKGKDKKNTTTGPTPGGKKIVILKREAVVDVPAVPVPSVAALSSNVEDIMKKAIASHFKAQEKIIIAEVQRAVRSEIKQTVLPELSKSVNMTVEQSVVRPLQSSMERFVTKAPTVKADKIIEAVTNGVEAPLKEAFTESMKSMMIPAFEAATREMFSQVAASLETNITPSQSSDATNAKIDALTTMVQALTVEVTNLRKAVGASQRAPPSAPAPDQSAQMERMRSEIIGMIQVRNYEAAFTKALSATTAAMAVFACKSASLSDVLGGTEPALTQPIILCLMQQLGTGLVSATDADLQITLAWLQEIALTLNPTDESIQRHIPSVLQQLVASINTKMHQGDPGLRRPLQMLLQVIRGMQR